MDDLELQRLAEKPAELKETAREALRMEMEMRGLDISMFGIETVETEEHFNDEPLVVVKRFRDMPEAAVARGLLESAGIPCFLADENIVRMDWLISNGVGQMRLLVRQSDLQTATELLAQDFSAENETNE